MYSTNGRKKESKEAASETRSFKSKMICNKCGFIEKDRYKVFGEQNQCNSCTSTDVRYEFS